MRPNYLVRKDSLLGLNFSTASQRLRKLVLWSLVQETGKDVCFRCGQRIGDVDDLSIEHKAPWQSVPDPKASFFDLENIAFSHLRCNRPYFCRGRKRSCDHDLSGPGAYNRPDGGLRCRICRRNRHRQYMRERRQVAKSVAVSFVGA